MKKRKAVPGAIASGSKEQARQLREGALKQVAVLKQKIHEIQQQSLKAMQESIDNFFNTQAQENLLQMVQAEEEIAEEVGQFLSAGDENVIVETGFDYLEPENVDMVLEESKIAEQAVEASKKSVEDAMRSAMDSVAQAEQAVSGLGK